MTAWYIAGWEDNFLTKLLDLNVKLKEYGKISMRYLFCVDFYPAKVRFPTESAVNADSCLNSNDCYALYDGMRTVY